MDDEPLYMLTAILVGGYSVDVVGPLHDLQEQYDAWRDDFGGLKVELHGIHDDAERSPKRVVLVAEHVLGLVLDRV